MWYNETSPRSYIQNHEEKQTMSVHVNGYAVVEKHGIKRSHQRQIKGKKGICDIPACTLHDDVLVVRILSDKFTVDTNGKERLESCIALSEVVINDPKTGYHRDSTEAIAEARELAKTERPLTISMLKRIKRPLQHGYSFEEVKIALAAFIGCHANRYCSNHFTIEDGEQMGMVGIMNALRTDRAIAPFADHVYRHIQTAIRREAFTSGLIKHGERDGDKFGTKGVQTGVDKDAKCPTCEGSGEDEDGESCNKCSGDGTIDVKVFASLRSADAPLVEDVNVYDVTVVDDQVTPLDLYQKTEDMRILSGRLRAAIEKADLTPQQVKVVALKYGMPDLVDNPFEPGTGEYESWARGELELNGTRIAKVLGCTRQRIGQQDKKCIKKLAGVADELDLEKFLP